jgi:C1A family cysteine protease
MISAFLASASLIQDTTVYQAKFAEWQQEFGVVVPEAELDHRLAAFSANDDFIATHNEKFAAGNSTFTVAHNQFSALNQTEFKDMVLKFPMPPPSNPKDVFTNELTELADSVDWTTKNAVTPIKNQAQCGSCWAFSTTGSLEGAYAIKNSKLVSFSEEQLVACDNAAGGGTDQGCNGGLMDNAFKWIEKNGGICTESEYPYTSGTGKVAACQKTCKTVAGSKPVKFTDVAHTENDLMGAVMKQPVSIAIEADQQSFQLYASGVLSGMCGTHLDHGVLAVGYGSAAGTNYWKVKNSWGTSWGMKGYVLLERGNPQSGGQCGILMSASFPTV